MIDRCHAFNRTELEDIQFSREFFQVLIPLAAFGSRNRNDVPVEIVKNELYGTVIRFESPFYKYAPRLLSNAIVRNVNYQDG